MTKPTRPGTITPEDIFLPSSGLKIGDIRLCAKRDPNNNIDFFLAGEDGREVNLTGEVLMSRATSNLTLTTTYQSIVGDGDSSKVRLLLPTIGEWNIEATTDFGVTTAGTGTCGGALYVNDSGTAETGTTTFLPSTTGRASPSQHWKVTTTAADTPIELKGKKSIDAGVGLAYAPSTCLTATIGAGGGSTVETVDHGTLSGRGDDDHTQYGQLATAETVPGLWDFTGGIKTDIIAESSAGVGVTADGVLLKDGVVAVGDVAFDDGTSDPLIDGAAAADGTENSVARKDHVHPKHHAQSHTVASHSDTTATGAETETLTDGSDADSLHVHGKIQFRFSITVEDPTNSEDITITFENKAVTITEMRAVLIGSATPSVTWTVRHHATDRSNAGNEVVTGGTTTTSTTAGSDVTSFNDATIPADSHIWLETTAKSGTVTELHVTGIGTYD